MPGFAVSTALQSGDALKAIRGAQNPDGGWGYHDGTSWTEPTVFALLALRAGSTNGDAFHGGLQWLASLQREDGAWPPHPAVPVSSWVTALVVSLFAEQKPCPVDIARAAAWLLRQTGRESRFLHRLRAWLHDFRDDARSRAPGWPWLPETASWVVPTAFTLIGLSRVRRISDSPELRERIQAGRQFLLQRECAGGGWNHGSSRALGYEAPAYPETTGIALLALRGAQSPAVTRGLEAAGKLRPQCRSVEGLLWLYLGLAAHGQTQPEIRLHRPPQTLQEASLLVLAGAAAQGAHPLAIEA